MTENSAYNFEDFYDFLSESLIPKSIKVVDETGREYIDENTGLKKYRILLEPLNVSSFSNEISVPTKIIVLFDSPNPTNLFLMYDKVYISENNDVSSVVPQYKENINTVTFFSKNPEETFVADPSSRNKRIFSKKAISEKKNLVTSSKEKSEGFEVFVPKKALSDNRTYETFNWRLVAKVKRSLDVSSINESQEIDLESNIKQKTVNAGVLCTSAQLELMSNSGDYSSANPYVFYRLSISPFNISKYNYENPLAPTDLSNQTGIGAQVIPTKNLAVYWLVNIDTVTDEELATFDILSWSPNYSISSSHGIKLKKYIQNTQGNLILDLSKSTGGAENIDPSLTISSDEYSLDTWSYNLDNLFLNESKNNAWALNSSVFERLLVDNQNYDIYSIFGRSTLSDLTTSKKIKEFTGSIATSNVVMNNSRGKPIFASLQFEPQIDALARGNLVATTAPVLQYCNDVYQPSSLFDIAKSNGASSAIEESNFVVTAAIEGPMKLLYNAVSVALMSRIFSSKTKDVRSSVYYHVSEWNSSYVLNGNVLLDDEKKEQYTLIKEGIEDSIGNTKYAKNILGSSLSLLDFYKNSVYNLLADQYNLTLQEIDSQNIDFYIELTNEDVIIANAEKIIKDYSSSEIDDIPSSYNVFKISSENINSLVYAYTNSPSASFVVPGGFGPYVIRERVLRSAARQSNDTLSSLVSSANIYKSYPFTFSIFSSYTQSTESPVSFSTNWSATISATYQATLSRNALFNEVYPPGTILEEDDKPMRVNLEPTQNPLAIFSGADRRSGDFYSTNPANNFLYTGDIQQGNVATGYGVGKSGLLPDYTAYIQISLREFGITCPLTKVYDTATANAVRTFQRQSGARFVDGVVDSETKALLASGVWKMIRNSDPNRFTTIINRVTANNPGVVKFINAAVSAIEIHELPSREFNYRKISFSGSTGPQKVLDTIWIGVPVEQLPSGAQNIVVNSITVVPGSAFAGASSYKGLSLVSAKAIPASVTTNTPPNPYDFGLVLKGAVDYTNSPIKIECNKKHSEYPVYAIRINGTTLGGKFGPFTEGYAINQVLFDISYTIDVFNANTVIKSGYKLETKTADVVVSYNVAGSVSGISPNKAEVIDLSGIKSRKYATTPVSITYPTWTGLATLDLTKTTIDFSDTEYKPPFVPYSSNEATPSYKDESVTINLTAPSNINLLQNTVSVSNVVSSTNNPVQSSSIEVAVSNNKIVFQTSALIYQNSDIIKTPEKLLSNFWLLKSDGTIIKKPKNTITSLDGLVMLCQPSEDPDKIGKPFGIDLTSLVTTAQSNQVEFNIDYGSFILINNSPNNGGLLYGFYDKNKKEFLGNNLYYVDLVSRGAENVYIAAIAIDADGNLGTNVDFFGPTNSSIFAPSIVPLKMACPIYNAEYVPSSRIGVSSISPNLSKLEQWPLNITAGSFSKFIYIDPAYGWTSWIKKYTGKTLKATYSTLNIDNVIWSQWAGKPYIDVVNETPIILSSKRIQLSKIPIATLAQPSFTKSGVTTPVVKVQTRSSEDSEWTDLDSRYIRNINCFTGIVDFVTSIVKDDSLIRVSYTIKSAGIPIKNINSKKLPINPFLNSLEVEPQKALHIYIKPSRIEVVNEYSNDFVSEYLYDSVIDFTYDTDIFNKFNSSSYDPFSLQIALIHVVNYSDIKDISLEDLRIKGGGIKSTLGKTITANDYSSFNINRVFQQVKEASSFWDIYPPDQQAYSKGGFIIIKLPKEVLNNFRNESELYSIISRNLTAGVVYKIQDMEGNDWGVL